MGLVDGALDSIGDSLKKANDKAFKKRLKKLAASGPEGKKAAEHLLKSMDMMKDAAAGVEDELADLGFEI